MKATASPELAADLAAETFARALESVDGYDQAKGRADQWLFGIARNVLGSSYRAGAWKRRHASAWAWAAWWSMTMPSTIARLSEESGEEAARALAALPEEQRQAIEARRHGRPDYEEIAGKLRCSRAVVRQRVSRGLSTLRARLAGG